MTSSIWKKLGLVISALLFCSLSYALNPQPLPPGKAQPTLQKQPTTLQPKPAQEATPKN
ncbi:hypothetical protein BN59_01394 [Legionella massiliensis]|uniref:Uncharacterized protein n=1 Tax=Legionella massiliensis TaxID=1034943 RepID=A0A078KVT1_9GAMM|nr:hypothetical protein [Legionella massiliensis]CDZ77112.1 hypothetical protein BN59_01394 [Legionella massiliensis]CEE12850.1 hypothetical protein BN1094_01394 [Legionella massiliensis]